MARRHDRTELSPLEPLNAQVTMTETGYPAALAHVAQCYGERVAPAPEPSWFWIFATPRSAAAIRRRGLRVIGTVTTTFIPPQSGIIVDRSVSPEAVPPVGSQAHAYLMLAETTASGFSGS